MTTLSSNKVLPYGPSLLDDDKILTERKRKALENHGGSGVLKVLMSDELQIAEHDIVLGLNIPDYPEPLTTGKQSGLKTGEAEN